ncbi:DNA N6-methyl adenine demethylase isoform X3 [Dendroctonus ponderosae]|uniref:Methylcytosine dioxygenase TET n=1 Tax=Dendroctonus ponderosae TaxID=77166 RepID=A0AAR5P8C7_DENPD|nr:DNA N6-methyl adenine demethylase isoform X3 [Dendroctonus ponderosae]
MSETLSQDPDGLGVAYTTLAPSYPSTPATPSSTVQDVPPGANLPPFSTFASEIDSNGTFSSVSDRLFSDTRLLDISNWDYYTETRLVERGENGLSIISSQPQYRPWESKPVDSTSAFAGTTHVNTFTDAFTQQNGASKLPSFQSQFQAFSESGAPNEPTLTTLTNLTPVSPNSASSPQSQTLTTLNSSFHTLSAVNPRSYPLVPAPIQAREIPSIQQQFLDERHIQLYSHPTANLTLGNTIHSASIFPTQNGTLIQNSQLISSPAVVAVLKSEPDLKLGGNLTTLHQQDPSGLKMQNVGLHPTQFQNPMAALNNDNSLYNGIEKKLNGTASIMTSPTRNDFRKKERRKIRANSLESSAESDGASSNMDLGSESSGQVAAVSSTDGYKAQHGMPVGMEHDISGGSMDKQVKKKRKRCGECVGCQRKDNCGDCAPCRNDKSHQICKQRRCEKLTEKKSYRGRKPNGPISSLGGGGLAAETNGGPVSQPQQPSSRPSPQPVTQPMPVQQQPMTPMPFYADPNRFPTPVWQADPSQVTGWQGQFIQQIPPAAQQIDTYQQYPNGIYQATYQQPAFEANTFYTGAVQVLTPTNTRPPSVPSQQAQMVPPRPNSNYSHTPSPSPATQAQQQPSQQQAQQTSNRQYQEYTQFGSAASTNEGSQSRPSSVNSVVNQNPTTPNQNYQQANQQSNQQQSQQNQPQQQTVYTTVSAGNFSPGSNTQQTQFVNASSGNGQPGYPQYFFKVNASSPQVVSHSSSGYPGNEQYSGQHTEWQDPEPDQMMWDRQQHPHQLHERKIEQQHYQQQVEQQNNHTQYMQTVEHSEGGAPSKMLSEGGQKTFSQADKVNLNTRIKTMILNKQQNDGKMDQEMKSADQNQSTGHFLWYSHHHHLDPIGVDGGPQNNIPGYDTVLPSNTQGFAQNNVKWTNYSKLKTDNELPLRLSWREEHYTRSQLWPLENMPLAAKDKFYITEKTSEKATISSIHERTTCRTPQSPSISSACSPRAQQCDAQNTSPVEPKTDQLISDGCLDLRSRHEQTLYSRRWEESGDVEKNCPSDGVQAARQSTLFAPPERTKIWLHDKRKSPHSVDSADKSKKTDRWSPKILGEEIPQCHCFPQNQSPPEPGTFYTHLGCANSLQTLRRNLEGQTGVNGPAIRIEKVKHTGKEGKTAQGCPVAKWVYRRVNVEEKYLVIVKHRTGHTCHSAYIIICLVVWEGVSSSTSDELYGLLTDKLNKFGLPTKRRCSTNDARTCACQGVDEETCGASYSFGCSWSMYYNGCKFARSKDVRKFRLSVKEEETSLETSLGKLLDHIGPMYQTLAPRSFANQTSCEESALECRLGTKPGRPFSGVTVSMDFCDHSHKEIHNMTDGCTVVVTLTKHRALTKPVEEQLHVLPAYVPDETNEFGSKEDQDAKVEKGEMDVFTKYESEVRTFSEPAEKCRKRKSKKGEFRKCATPQPSSPSVSSTSLLPSSQPSPSAFSSSEIQSGQVSSTVLDSPGRNPISWRYANFSSSYENSIGMHSNGNNLSNYLPQFAVLNSPQSHHDHSFSRHYNQQGYLNHFDYQTSNFQAIPNLLPPFSPGKVSRANEPNDRNVKPPKSVDVKLTDNSECFRDPEIGGVAIALSHGSVLFECAKHELHATTSLKNPNRTDPTRISLVFYQHRNLNKSQHGFDEYVLKQKNKLDDVQSHPVEFDARVESSSLERSSSEVLVKST